MRQDTMTTRRLLVAALFLSGTLVSSAVMVAADTSVQQSSGTNVEQGASVDGGDAYINQESQARSGTDEAFVEQRSEQTVTKELGEPAQVERNVERTVRGDNDSISFNVDQQVEETESGVIAAQDLEQRIDDLNTEETQTLGEQATGTTTTPETVGSGQATEQTADVNPMRQGGSLVLLQDVVAAIQDALAALF